jgi:hypothetical protein
MLTILKKNDTHDSIEYQITNDDGSVVNLTGATVNFVMGKKNKLITNAPATITAANDGIVEYQLTSTDTLVSGTFLAEFVVTFSNGTQKTFPSNGYITVTVEQNLDTNQANVVLDMIAEKQGDFTSKLNSILLQAGNINMSAMNEYTWTATEGQLIYTFPSGSNYSNSTKWFQVSVGNVPVANSLVNRSYTNQFALIIDPTYIQAGMEVRAMWVEPIVPITTGHHATHELNGQDEIDVAKLRNYQELVATPVTKITRTTPEKYGAKGDGVTDDTVALTAAIADLKSSTSGTRILELKNTYKGNIAINQMSHLIIEGKGTLKGTITVSGTVFGSDTQRYSGDHDIKIRDITIDGESTRNGIILEYVFGVEIEGTLFQNCVEAIHINDQNYTQHVSRTKINRNRFLNCGKDLVSQSVNSIYTTGDLQFIGNYSETTYGAPLANTNGLLIDHVDGIQISDNVFFGSNATTNEHINIQSATFVNIDNNQVFLGKNSGIYLYNVQNLKIVDNIICWQKNHAINVQNIQALKISDNVISWRSSPTDTYTGYGINIGRDANGDTNTWGAITDNTIILPPLRGIYANSVGKLNIATNTIIGSSNTNSPIRLDFCEYSTIVNNMCYGFTGVITISGGTNVYEYNTFTGGKTTYTNFVPKLRTKVYSGGETTIDLNDTDVIIFNNSTSTTVNSITLTDLSTARKILFFSYNANTIISRSTPNLTTYGAAGTLTIGATGSMEFLVYGGSLLEVNRNNVS